MRIHLTNSGHIVIADVPVVGGKAAVEGDCKIDGVPGTVCTGAAARIPGTLVYNLLSEEAQERAVLRIGHPAGVIEVDAVSELTPAGVKLTKIAYERTAHRIMEGYVYVRNSSLGNV